LQLIFTVDGWMMYTFNLPLSARAYCWVPFRLSIHRLYSSLSQHESNIPKQVYPSQLEKTSMYPKRKRTRCLSEYIHIYQSSLYICDVCIPNHLVTRSVTKGRDSPPWKNVLPPEKMTWIYCMHNYCFRTCYRCEIWASHRKSFAPPGVQTGYGAAGDCCLVTSVIYATQPSLFTIKIFRFFIKF